MWHENNAQHNFNSGYDIANSMSVRKQCQLCSEHDFTFSKLLNKKLQ